MFRLSLGWLLLAFIADLFSLFLLADAVGAWWTLAWVVFAMLLGAWVIVDAGDTLTMLGGVFMSPKERIEAVRETPWMLLVGVLFFMPGIVSDVLAVILWLPSLRQRLWTWIRHRRRPVSTAQATSPQTDDVVYTHQQQVTIIEGEWQEKSPPTPPNDRLHSS